MGLGVGGHAARPARPAARPPALPPARPYICTRSSRIRACAEAARAAARAYCAPTCFHHLLPSTPLSREKA